MQRYHPEKQIADEYNNEKRGPKVIGARIRVLQATLITAFTPPANT